MQKRVVSTHRIPVKMRDYIPYYFVQKTKSSTAAVIVGLIIELLRNKGNDTLWKISKGKGPTPGNREMTTKSLF